ncbi:hypothetical protein B0H19DRAFT_381347 [Mycena capillaripes]|nr:hypothetical protein B0H19DRAFT_381347 [Mycena capillaripes]
MNFVTVMVTVIPATVMTMPRRPPGRPLIIPPLPLEIGDCADPTAVSLNPPQSPERGSKERLRVIEEVLETKARGSRIRRRAIEEAVGTKRPRGTHAGSEPARKRTRKVTYTKALLHPSLMIVLNQGGQHIRHGNGPG